MNETMTQIINAATPILCLLITAGAQTPDSPDRERSGQ